MLNTLVVRHPSTVVAVDCTPNGNHIVAGTTSGHVSQFDSSVGDPYILQHFSGEVWAVSIDAIGQTVVVGTAQKRPKGGVFYWIAHDGTILFEDDLQSPVWGVSVSPSGRYAACGTWSGDIAVYERVQDHFKPIWRNPEPLGNAGVYGLTIDDHPHVAASVYERGLLALDVRSGTSGIAAIATGLFHVSRLTAAGTLLVGCRDGIFCELSIGDVLNGTAKPIFSPRLSRRSLPGVASSRDRTVRYAAAFDGTLAALGSDNSLIWSRHLSSELWAVATSADGSCVSVACGDGTVRVIHQEPGVVTTFELKAWASALQEGRASAQRFAQEISRLSAFDFGFGQIGQLRATLSISDQDVVNFARVIEYAEDLHVVYHAGVLYRSLAMHKDAIRCFQRASSIPELYSEALNSAAQCFGELGLLEVQHAIARRASMPAPNAQEIALLYDLGRMYEETGRDDRARRSYECVVGWDVSYRDAAERLEAIELAAGRPQTSEACATSISQLLGPNVPRPAETDGQLYPVLEARTREMRSSDVVYKRRLHAVRRLQAGGAFYVQRDSALRYNTSAYWKYESAPLEDNSKKHLEAVNFLAEVDLTPMIHSLDIGTATCRYPILLERFGLRSYGIDISSSGYDFHRSAGGLFSRFAQADGCALPFASTSFDLVTCMMGTFNHLTSSDIPRFLSECKRVLRPGGKVVIGCWDIECPFLSYLTMYSLAQLAQLRARAVTQCEFISLATTAEFSRVRVVPFYFFSDRLVRGLRLESYESHDAEILVDVDFALQGRLGVGHGQMYLAICSN